MLKQVYLGLPEKVKFSIKMQFVDKKTNLF